MTTESLDPATDSRRGFLNAALGFFGTIAALGVIYPVGLYLWPRREKRHDGRARSMKIPLAEVPIGDAKFVRFFSKPTVIIRPNEQELVALSAVCTHLGCIVKWNDTNSELRCPCHGGVFDTKGAVIGGPPPSPLNSYSTTIEDEYIVIKET